MTTADRDRAGRRGRAAPPDGSPPPPSSSSARSTLFELGVHPVSWSSRRFLGARTSPSRSTGGTWTPPADGSLRGRPDDPYQLERHYTMQEGPILLSCRSPGPLVHPVPVPARPCSGARSRIGIHRLVHDTGTARPSGPGPCDPRLSSASWPVDLGSCSGTRASGSVTPGMWIAAAVAAGAVWGWPFAFVILKPDVRADRPARDDLTARGGTHWLRAARSSSLLFWAGLVRLARHRPEQRDHAQLQLPRPCR